MQLEFSWWHCGCSVTKSCSISATPWTAACQASLSFTISQSLLKLMSIESVMPSNYLIFCHSLFHLPSIFPSIRVFSNESALRIRWPKYWSFSSSYKYSGWFPLGLTGWSPCCPRDSQESFPAPQFESINSSVLGFLYSPALTSIHDSWKFSFLRGLIWTCCMSWQFNPWIFISEK